MGPRRLIRTFVVHGRATIGYIKKFKILVFVAKQAGLIVARLIFAIRKSTSAVPGCI